MKSPSELYASLSNEHMALTKNIIKLQKFMKTDDYAGLKVEEQRLLIIQHNVMLVYADVLLQRMDEVTERWHHE